MSARDWSYGPHRKATTQEHREPRSPEPPSGRGPAAPCSVEAQLWEPEPEPAPSDALRGTEVVFNFAREPISEGRWTDEKKRRIRDSRVVGTRNLVAGLALLKSRPRVLVSASAVGYYGDRSDEELDERSAAGHGFLAEVCANWEREAMAASQLGIRVVCVRIGIVRSATPILHARLLMPSTGRPCCRCRGPRCALRSAS